jgi:diaminopimelate epimerase
MLAGELAKRLCERHYGAGADGMLVVHPCPASAAADFSMVVINADGGEAEMSGNGIRCAAAYVYHSGQWSNEMVRFETQAGIKSLRRLSHRGQTMTFEVEMGRPQLASRDIPLLIDPALAQVINYPLTVGDDVCYITASSMGNPHCSLILDDLETIDFKTIGPRIEHHPLFPQRTNVEFVKVISRDEIEVLYWERGVGHTLSSGTGSCAAAIAAMLNGLTGRQVRVSTLAGELSVKWRDDDVVVLAGPVEVVYQGEWLAELC